MHKLNVLRNLKVEYLCDLILVKMYLERTFALGDLVTKSSGDVPCGMCGTRENVVWCANRTGELLQWLPRWARTRSRSRRRGPSCRRHPTRPPRSMEVSWLKLISKMSSVMTWFFVEHSRDHVVLKFTMTWYRHSCTYLYVGIDKRTPLVLCHNKSMQLYIWSALNSPEFNSFRTLFSSALFMLCENYFTNLMQSLTVRFTEIIS